MTIQLKEYLNKGNIVQELDEKAILELIDSKQAIVLKLWMSGCSFCTKYAPIFDKAANDNKDKGLVFAALKMPADLNGSEFASKYMMVGDKIKALAPATMLFFEGELKAKHYGAISEAELSNFLLTGEPPVNKKQVARQELQQLFALKGEYITIAEKLPAINNRIAELEQILTKG